MKKDKTVNSKQKKQTTAILILVLAHFLMSIIISVTFFIFDLDTSDLMGGIGAASPLMCLALIIFDENANVGLCFGLGIMVVLILISTFIIAMFTRKHAVYSIGIIADVIARAALMATGYIDLEIPLVWTGLLVNALVFAVILILNGKKKADVGCRTCGEPGSHT